MNPKWTSLPYLLDSKGPAASFFIKLTQDDSLMTTINFLSQWALFIHRPRLDFRLFVSFIFCWRYDFSAMYTLSHPSFVGASYMMPFEGSYLWIDKNLVEFAALGLMCDFYITNHRIRSCVRTWCVRYCINLNLFDTHGNRRRQILLLRSKCPIKDVGTIEDIGYSAYLRCFGIWRLPKKERRFKRP